MRPSKRLSHLNALRALEAVIRTGSFQGAASGLGLTPSAVSQKVRQLEAYVGTALLRRSGRGVVPTSTATAASGDLDKAMRSLERAWSQLRRETTPTLLSVTLPPSIATMWFLPKLDRLREIHPDIEISLDASDRLVDIEEEGIDFAIRYGPWRAEQAGTLLCRETLFPVCSPTLMAGQRPLSAPGDLKQHTLIHDRTLSGFPDFPSWTTWLAAAGTDEVNADSGVYLNASAMVVQAALLRQGVALARELVVAGEIAHGTLVKPFELALESPFSYFLLQRKHGRSRRVARLFRTWIIEQFQIRSE